MYRIQLFCLLLMLTGCGGASASNNPTTPSSSSSPASSSSSAATSSAGSSSSTNSLTSSASSNSSSSRIARLHINGTELLDDQGTAQRLRGWNWGRWGLAQANDASDNKQQGANAVRIPLRWWGYYSGTNIDSRDDSQTATAGIDAGHLAILDSTIQQASAAGLWIILFIDSDCGQNGTQDTDEINYCDPTHHYKNGHNFWSDPDARARFINVWKFIAARYKNTPYIAMFEPLPEPNPMNVADSEITVFYDQVMSAIRSVAPGIPFILGPRSYQMSQAEKAYNPQWQDVIYTGNLFVYTNKTQSQNIADLSTRLNHLLYVRNTYSAPIFVQQTGVQSGEDPSLVYLNSLLSLLNSNQLGYTYWEYRDTYNPNAYGVIYQDGMGGWITKTDFLTTIVNYFQQL